MTRTPALLVFVSVCHVSLAHAQESPPEPPSPPSVEPPSVPSAEPPSAAPAANPEPPADAPPPAAEPGPEAPPAPAPATPTPLAPLPPTAAFESEPTAKPAAPRSAPAAATAAATTAPAAGASPSEPPPSEKSESKGDDQNGLLGPFRIGPIIGVGLPSLINVGGVIKLTRYFAAGLNVGIAPNVKFAYYGDATLLYHAYSVYAHVHPFGGGFYLGASIGYALAKGTAEQSIALPPELSAIYPGVTSPITLRSSGRVQTMVLTPELGYFYTFKVGFSIGLGAGLQLPIAASDVHFDESVSANVPAEVLKQYLDPTARAVKDTLDRVGQAIIPTVGLSVGWLL